jgi:phosphonate metabolism-associated iron-containing alcohol dehydrogenase
MTDVWHYYIPTKIIFGVGSLNKLAEVVGVFSPKKIVLVTGKQSMKKFGIAGKIIENLKGYSVAVYDNVEHNPTSRNVEDGVQFLRKEEGDLVIGLGGGSAIDFAKATAILLKNSGSVSEYLSKNREIINKGLPVIAIPTTAGTGSEVTQYASIIHQDTKTKISLTHDYVRPNVAIVEPTLTSTMPKFVTATTGLDSLSQCIEAYWSRNHTPISDVFALNGIKLISENIVNAYNFPDKMEFRSNMSLASLFSGIAISIATTTIVHSVSYPLTVRFNVPHGLACSLTLPSFIRYNSEVSEGRVLDMAKAINTDTVEDFIRKIEEIILNVKLPRRLSNVGVKSEDIDLIVQEGFRPDRARNNPRAVTSEALREILKSIL